MDPQPDGTQIIGGAAPGATLFDRTGDLAYVALANVDRIAVVSLAAQPRVMRGLDLRLYPGAPYGAEPVPRHSVATESGSTSHWPG